jgi:hypothetical protein
MYRPGIDPVRRRSFFPNIFGFPMIRAPQEEMRHIDIVNLLTQHIKRYLHVLLFFMKIEHIHR